MDLPNRDELEILLAAAAGRVFGRTRRELLKLLGNPPDLGKLTAAFWEAAGVRSQNVIRPIMERIYLEAAERFAVSLIIGVDWALVNEGAVSWASGYTFDLVRGLDATSQRALQRAVSAYFEQGQTMGELTDRIGRIFSPQRAEAIAVTEVTRAASQGEIGIAAEIRRQGVDMIPVWQANNDSLVCPICGPLHGVKAQGGIFTASSGTFSSPPAHVRCRCWLNHELPEA